jgi:hypothetical protein
MIDLEKLEVDEVIYKGRSFLRSRNYASEPIIITRGLVHDPVTVIKERIFIENNDVFYEKTVSYQRHIAYVTDVSDRNLKKEHYLVRSAAGDRAVTVLEHRELGWRLVAKRYLPPAGDDSTYYVLIIEK